MSALSERLGVDRAAFREVLALQIRRDFEGSAPATGSPDAPGALDDSPLLVNVAHNLTMGTLVAYFAYVNFEPFGFAFVQMIVLMVAVAMALVAEFGVALLDPADHAMLAPLPIASRTLFAARAANALFYVAVIATSWCLPGAILAWRVHGGSLGAALAHVAASLLAALASAVIVGVGGGVFARVVSARRLHDAVLWAQVLFSLMLFLGFLYGPSLLPGADGFVSFSRSGGALACPPAWFAALAAGGPSRLAAAAIAAPVLGIAVALGLASRYGAFLRSGAGARRAAAGERASRGPGAITRLVRRFAVREAERPSFDFTTIQMSRERAFRLRVYPLLGFPIALAVMAASMPSAHDRTLWTMLLLYAPNLYFPAVLSQLPFTSTPEAAWLWRAAPVPRRSDVLIGAEKAFLLRFVAPLYVVIAVYAVWVWGPLVGLGNAAAAALVACIFTALDFRAVADLPFTRGGSRTFSQLEISHVMGRVVVLAVVSAAQFFLAGKSAASALIVLPVLVAVFVGLLAWQRGGGLGDATEAAHG
jgi:ABC-2 type transport system permease protein